MKMTVSWEVVPCSLVEIDEVSEVFAVSTVKVMSDESCKHL
jgi:hypothetical protein